MEAAQSGTHKQTYLFNIDILIESDTNGRALEKLLHILNNAQIQDYMVKEGIHIGATIQSIMDETLRKQQTKPDPSVALQTEKKQSPPVNKKKIQEDQQHTVWDQFQRFKENNCLVRLTIIKAMGIKLSIPCRILNTDPDKGNVSVYHVDEKQVYLFKINEIDDFSIS